MSVEDVRGLLLTSSRPVLWLGHGIRLAGAVDLIDPLLDHLGVPALVSWAGLDMTAHPLVFGRAGIYGSRAANAIVQQADLVLAIGTRLAIPQIGYDIDRFAPGARIIVVDIDQAEAAKYARFEPVVMDAGDFMRGLLGEWMVPVGEVDDTVGWHEWWVHCNALREQYPVIGPEHADPPGYISPYRFLKALEPHLKPDQVIITDSGTALLCSHQVLTLKPPQRLITTTGLGEMGFGLPAAIGASFARGKREVLCLNTDGGMMLNLQELQTIAHHHLPVKIIVFCNDGYGMIKATQKAMGHVRSGVDKASGVSCPNYLRVAEAFGITARWLRDNEDVDAPLKWLMHAPGPALLAVYTSPETVFAPKVATIRREDGSLYSPALDEMSPLLVPA